MTPRLVAKVEVSALIRRTEGKGGTAAVLASGDGEAGAILLFLADRGIGWGFLERSLDAGGGYHWRRTGPHNPDSPQDVSSYIERRRNIDSDLWIVELDIPGAERFADEMTSMG